MLTERRRNKAQVYKINCDKLEIDAYKIHIYFKNYLISQS